MLHFTYTAVGGPGGAEASQVVQLIDLSAYSAAVSAGLLQASASADFNRVAGDAETDTSFALTFFAMEGDPADFSTKFQAGEWIKPISAGSVLSDGDPDTWETASATYLLPTNTDYLALQVRAFENIENDWTGTEFDGHYAVNVTASFDTIPEPNTFAICAVLGLTGAGVGWWRRRRKAKG